MVLSYVVRLQTKAAHTKEVVTAADYAVRVTGLPLDAEKGEVMSHFNRLFRLDRPDWENKGWCGGLCFRKTSRRTPAEINEEKRWEAQQQGQSGGIDPVTNRARPNFHHTETQHQHIRYVDPIKVTDAANTGDSMYLNTYIAEVSLVHPNGDIIRRYLRLKKLQMKVLRARATAKKYNESSPHDHPSTLVHAAALAQSRIGSCVCVCVV